MKVWSVIVAAGKGTRFGAAKQLQTVADRRLIDWSVGLLSPFGPTIVVGPGFEDPDVGHERASAAHDPASYFACKSPLSTSIMAKVARFASGGASRSESVRAGLACVGVDATHVLIHDAARPALTVELVERVLAALCSGADAVIPVVPVIDTLRTIDGEALDRSRLVAVQTPQGFAVDVLRRAHQAKSDATDDSALVTALGCQVIHVAGDPQNLKVTEALDLQIAELVLRRRSIPGE